MLRALAKVISFNIDDILGSPENEPDSLLAAEIVW